MIAFKTPSEVLDAMQLNPVIDVPDNNQWAWQREEMRRQTGRVAHGKHTFHLLFRDMGEGEIARYAGTTEEASHIFEGDAPNLETARVLLAAEISRVKAF